MRVVAVIPCRAGSKGIPHKNRMEFAGQPLFLWSVAAGLEDSRVRTVCISTDDDEILSWGKWASSKNDRIACVRRPAEMSRDSDGTEIGMFHACREVGVMKHEFVLLLQPTSPLRHANIVGKCLDASSGNGSSFSCYCPGHIAWVQSGGLAAPLYPISNRPRRQDLALHPRIMMEDGNVYSARYDQMSETKTRFGNNPVMIESELAHSVQIDGLDDAKTLRCLCADDSVKSWIEKVRLLLPK
jgi:CMP-N,N'-diacetyllegionaminic acid synthase